VRNRLDGYKRYSIGLLLLTVTLSVTVAHAQEVGLDDGEHLPQHRLQLGVDGNYSTGNLKQRRASASASLFKRWGDQLAALSSTRYSYMKNGDILFADDLRSVLILTYRPLATVQPYAIGLYHNSYTRFIDRRWMGGAGLAWSALRSKDQQLKLGLAGARELTRWESRPPPFPPSMDPVEPDCLYKGEVNRQSCERQMWRLIPRLVGHHKLVDQHIILEYEALWVVDPLDLEDERVYASLTVTVPVLSWLSVYTHYDVSFESTVLDHRERLDAHLSLGLKVSASE